MKKQKSSVRIRCQDGWTLFHQMGDSFDYESTQKHPEWERHQKIIRKYDAHNSCCDICRKGKEELKMTFEEMAVEGAS